MDQAELEAKITAAYPAVAKDPVQVKEYLTLRLPAAALVPVVGWLKREAGFSYLHMVTGVDYLGPISMEGFVRDPNPHPFLPDGAAPQIAPLRKTPEYPYRDSIEVVYALMNFSARLTVFLKTEVARDGGKLPSIVREFKSADWQEREIFDLFGTTFEGHPNLKKILTPDFIVGNPLRKDYAHKKDRFD
ncbi:MAG: NADH-quinone oxidoreductase subunit C [Elusimicrobiota bacterium]